MLKKLSLLTGGTIVLTTLGCDNDGRSIIGHADGFDDNTLSQDYIPDKYEYPGVPKSEFYEVTVIQGEKRTKYTVFQSTCPEYQAGYMNLTEVDAIPLDIFKGRSISWTDFSIQGVATIEVRVLNLNVTPMGSVRILPSRHGIFPQVNGNVIRFTITQPGQFSVEIGQNGYRNGLMIFANPAETDIPDPSSEEYYVVEEGDQAEINSIPTKYSGIYFKNGIHNMGVYELPNNIDKIYFEEGSWVYGTIRMLGKFGIRIWGRGVLSSDKLNYRESHCIEAINGSSNITVEGIVIADYKHFSVRLISARDTVSWVKVIGGWIYNTDGIRPGPNSTVSNCFIWANDDSIKPYRDNIVFTDCVCWQLNNGGIIQLSWGSGNATNVTIRRIDILRGEWNRQGPNRGVVNCVGDRFAEGNRVGLQRNWLLEDIVIENPVPFVFGIVPNPASPNTIEGMIFKDWDVRMNMNSRFSNLIQSADPDNRFRGLEFDNFRVNGVLLNESNWITEGKFVVRNIETPEFKHTTSINH